MKNVIIQAILLLTVAIIVGLIFVHGGINFFIGFALGIVLQYVGFYIFRIVTEILVNVEARKLEIELAKELSSQGLEVECPCAKKIKAFAPIRLDSKNVYKCQECNKDVTVVIAAETALVTTPILNTDTTDLANYGKQF